METIINKELISVALRMYPQYSSTDECTGNIQYRTGTNVVHFEVNSNSMQQINIYELAHKCKEWALTQECSIESTFRHTIGLAWVVYTIKYNGYDRFGNKREHTYKQEFYSDTEPNSIFVACQWVLDSSIGNI